MSISVETTALPITITHNGKTIATISLVEGETIKGTKLTEKNSQSLCIGDTGEGFAKDEICGETSFITFLK